VTPCPQTCAYAQGLGGVHEQNVVCRQRTDCIQQLDHCPGNFRDGSDATCRLREPADEARQQAYASCTTRSACESGFCLSTRASFAGCSGSWSCNVKLPEPPPQNPYPNEVCTQSQALGFACEPLRE